MPPSLQHAQAQEFRVVGTERARVHHAAGRQGRRGGVVVVCAARVLLCFNNNAQKTHACRRVATARGRPDGRKTQARLQLEVILEAAL